MNINKLWCFYGNNMFLIILIFSILFLKFLLLQASAKGNGAGRQRVGTHCRVRVGVKASSWRTKDEAGMRYALISYFTTGLGIPAAPGAFLKFWWFLNDPIKILAWGFINYGRTSKQKRLQKERLQIKLLKNWDYYFIRD